MKGPSPIRKTGDAMQDLCERRQRTTLRTTRGKEKAARKQSPLIKLQRMF